MKKIMTVLLSCMLVLSLAACGKETKEEAKTPAQRLVQDFKEKAKSGNYNNAEELAQAILENEEIPFAGATMTVEPGYLNGFSDEIAGFSDGAMFGPMIGAIPFVGYVFVLEDGTDTGAFMQTLKDKADLRWNVCTEADEMVTDFEGDTVCFIMAPLSFDEE